MLPYQSISNLDYLPAVSPNSYFTGLPLLIQPSELCIIHPQHVVDMKCRNTFSGIINNSCSETEEQNGGQIKHEGETTPSTQWPNKYQLTGGTICRMCFTTLQNVWWGYWSVLMWNDYRESEISGHFLFQKNNESHQDLVEFCCDNWGSKLLN